VAGEVFEPDPGRERESGMLDGVILMERLEFVARAIQARGEIEVRVSGCGKERVWRICLELANDCV